MSFKRIALLGFSIPFVIIVGAIASVVLGHGQAVMLPSTAAALLFYGALIAVGAAWHDSIPRLVEPNTTYLIALGAVTLLLATITWLSLTHGVAGLLWRPVLAAAICLWFGVVLASIVPRRVFA